MAERTIGRPLRLLPSRRTADDGSAGSAHPSQPDLGHRKRGDCPVHDLQGLLERKRLHAVLVAVGRGGVAEGAADRRRVAGPQDGGGERVVGGAPRPDRDLFLAGVLAGIEPGGVHERRREGESERGGPAARPFDAARPDAIVHEAVGERAQPRHRLLPAAVGAIRRTGRIALIFFNTGVIRA